MDYLFEALYLKIKINESIFFTSSPLFGEKKLKEYVVGGDNINIIKIFANIFPFSKGFLLEKT